MLVVCRYDGVILESENSIRRALAAAPYVATAFDDPDFVPDRVTYLQTLADNCMIDVFAQKELFVLDAAPPPATEDLTVLVVGTRGKFSRPRAN